jgi:hypothetical protein
VDSRRAWDNRLRRCRLNLRPRDMYRCVYFFISFASGPVGRIFVSFFVCRPRTVVPLSVTVTTTFLGRDFSIKFGYSSNVILVHMSFLSGVGQKIGVERFR